jgi:hypothetical protein
MPERLLVSRLRFADPPAASRAPVLAMHPGMAARFAFDISSHLLRRALAYARAIESCSPFVLTALRGGMSFKRIATAADLVRFGCALRIECGRCFAAQTLSATQVAQRCGTGDLAKIKARLKCSRCGAKDAQLVVLDPP